MRQPRTAPIVLLTLLACVRPARAGEPFHYPEGRHGKGELKVIHGVPVLRAQGTPEEVGEQEGVFVLKPANGLLRLADRFLKAQGWARLYPVLLKTGTLMKSHFPADHLKELEAAARVSGWPPELLIFGNTAPDLRAFGGCSALLVEGRRSATGGPLFGRNLDWPPFGPLHEYTLVAVYRPKGKLAFASITYPGLLGVVSGMNEKGLALADLTVTATKDGSPPLNLAGTPYTLALRRLLEECSTIEEAERLLRSLKRTVRQNVAICDRTHAAVLEVTPRNLVVRHAVAGICPCTNHFRTPELAVSKTCDRYAVLDRAREAAKLNVAGVARRMDAVNQGDWTLQTMIFEPSALRLHVAFGKGWATRLPLHTLELAPLFGKGTARRDR